MSEPCSYIRKDEGYGAMLVLDHSQKVWAVRETLTPQHLAKQLKNNIEQIKLNQITNMSLPWVRDQYNWSDKFKMYDEKELQLIIKEMRKLYEK